MNLKLNKYMKVMLALTYNCPCNCSHCGADLYKNKDYIPLNKQEILNILDSISALGAEFVYFFGGEPLLDKNIYEYISYAKSLNLKTMLDTNGVLLNKEVVVALSQSGLDVIGISLDSPIEEIHDHSRGVKGLYRKNLINACLCRKNNIAVYFSTVATKQNLKNGEISLLVKLADSLDVDVRILSPIQCGKLNSVNELTLSKEDINLLKKHLSPGRVYWERQEQCTEDCSFFCAVYERLLIYISAYGDIQPCCYFPISFGNIREEKIEIILERMWNSKLFDSQTELNGECPSNSQYIRQLYGLDNLKQYPRRASY